MGDTDKLKIRSMGVVDIQGLDDMGLVTPTSFTMAEVRARNPSWGLPEPRPTTEYPASPSIELSKVSDILKEFSTSKDENRSKKTLRNSITDYVFHLESTKNLLCIHSRHSPEFYYDRTVLRIPGALASRRKKNCPRVLVVTNSEAEASRVRIALQKEQRKVFGNSHYKPGVDILRNNSEEDMNLSSAEVLVGSIEHIFNFIDDAKRNNRMRDVKEFLKFVIINNAEKFVIVPKLDDLLDEMSDLFGNSWTRFIFMYHFSAVHATPILDVVQTCHEKLIKGMFIEVETPRVRNLFDRISFQLVVPSSEFVDRKAAQAISKKQTLPERHIPVYSNLFTAQSQKIIICANLIQRLRSDRERRQKHLSALRKRRERILIVTKSSQAAITVMMSLRGYSEKLTAMNKFSVHCILTQDSVDNVEQRNFEFRHGTLDVLVINWFSINAVIRGTVDSVIIYDSPPACYFQTMMEAEMENLISRICVRLKLYILLDQQADQALLPEYVKLLTKYKKRAPQWFRTLYEKYRAEFNARLDAPEFFDIDQTLVADVDLDATLQ